MKKIFYIATVAALALVSCSKNNEIDLTKGDDVLITYNAVAGMNTKALVESSAYPTDGSVTFGTIVKDQDGNTYIKQQEVTYDTDLSTFNTAVDYYWPKSSSTTLNFYAYSPFGISVELDEENVQDGFKITGYDVAANQDKDVMIAEEQTGLTSKSAANGENGVSTIFHHKLALLKAINVNLDKEYSSATIKVKEIKLGGISHKGDFTNTEEGKHVGAWTATTDTTIVSLFSGETEVEKVKDDVDALNIKATLGYDYYLLLPQTVTENQTLYVSYTIENASEYTEPVNVKIPLNKIFTSNIEINKKYTVTLTFGLDQILWDASVTDWEEGTTTAVSVKDYQN